MCLGMMLLFLEQRICHYRKFSFCTSQKKRQTKCLILVCLLLLQTLMCGTDSISESLTFLTHRKMVMR
nr:MAG TPA: hypothetical protein [Caudoviricetes sp.]